LRKLLILTTLFIFIMSSVGLCAVPDTSFKLADIQVGYTYYNLKATSGGHDLGNTRFNEIYGTVSFLGLGAFATHFHSGNTFYTDCGLKANIFIPNIAVMLGNRHSSPDNNSLFYGLSVNQDLMDGFGVYGTYQNGRHFSDKNIGITYALSDNAKLNISWKNLDDKNGQDFKGFGTGITVNF